MPTQPLDINTVKSMQAQSANPLPPPSTVVPPIATPSTPPTLPSKATPPQTSSIGESRSKSPVNNKNNTVSLLRGVRAKKSEVEHDKRKRLFVRPFEDDYNNRNNSGNSSPDLFSEPPQIEIHTSKKLSKLLTAAKTEQRASAFNNNNNTLLLNNNNNNNGYSKMQSEVIRQNKNSYPKLRYSYLSVAPATLS